MVGHVPKSMPTYLVIAVENSIYLEYPLTIHNNHVKLCSSGCVTLPIYAGSVVTTHSTVRYSIVRIVALDRIELPPVGCKPTTLPLS